MRVRNVTIHKIRLPLKQTFKTALTTLTDRQLLIVQVELEDGTIGWGECSAFETPWYTEETVSTCQHVLQTYLIPELLKVEAFNHPEEINRAFKKFRGHHMAKSCLETAVWDAYAKQLDQPLYKLLGGVRNEIEVGTAVGMQKDIHDLILKIEKAVETGYRRIKLKVQPGNDLEVLSSVRSRFPDVPLMVDANSSYTLENKERLKEMDRFNLLMIEQPLGSSDLIEHAELQSYMSTPICLDESINSFEAAQTAIALKSARILAIKHSRVGGLTEAIRIHDYCKQHGVEIWAGGMIESGIGKAHNIALATLGGFVYPGDITASANFWETDIIQPAIKVRDGKIKLSERPGIGYEIDYDALTYLSEEKYDFKR